MKKLACALLFATTLFAGHDGKRGDNDGWYGNDNGQNGWNGWNDKKGGPVHLAEPSAIPELILCMGGITFLAWRQRKRA